MKTSRIRPQISPGSRHLLPIMVLALSAPTSVARAESPVIRTAGSKLPKNKVIATINLDAAVSLGVAVDPNGQYVHVGANGVTVVSTATNSVVTTIELPHGYGSRNLAVSPDGSTLYAESNSYFAINTSTWSVVQTLPIQYPSYTYMAMSPDGTKLYCVNCLS